MSVKSLLRIAETYLRHHPVPAEMVLFERMLKLSYAYSTPFTNSKKKSDVLIPLEDLPANKMSQPLHHKLNFD